MLFALPNGIRQRLPAIVGHQADQGKHGTRSGKMDSALQPTISRLFSHIDRVRGWVRRVRFVKIGRSGVLRSKLNSKDRKPQILQIPGLGLGGRLRNVWAATELSRSMQKFIQTDSGIRRLL
jgi:hypothetical protein